MRVHATDRAISDLMAISDYLADFSEPAALAFIDSYEKALAQLRDLPGSGQRSTHHPDTRVLRFGTYRFMYRLLEDRVELFRILEGRGRRTLP